MIDRGVTVDYAIMKTGGKQYRVRPGDVLDVEKLPAEEGSFIELGDVLAVSRDGELTLGSPMVDGASVLAQVRSQYRDDKVLVFKYKRKVRYRRKKGHRQPYTRLYITSISYDGTEIGVLEPPDEPILAHGLIDDGAPVDEPEENGIEPVGEIEEAPEPGEEPPAARLTEDEAPTETDDVLETPAASTAEDEEAPEAPTEETQSRGDG